MSEVVTASVDRIAMNPFRRLHDYPYIQSKLDALDRSIAEVGLWPSIIARPLGDHKLWTYEIAFGHHRLEAAKRHGLKEIPLIIEDLSDKEMLQYMGRENLEDYNASFLIQLESWEAALKSGLLARVGAKSPEAIEIARLLGWLELREDNYTRLNHTARACQAAYGLITGGYVPRTDFAGLSVQEALNSAETAWLRVQQADKAAAERKTPRAETELYKKDVIGGAFSRTATQIRDGAVKSRDIRSHVDFNIMDVGSKKPSPLFESFANQIADNLRRTLNNDADGKKLANIEAALSQITLLDDYAALRRLRTELINLAERAQRWHDRLQPARDKVIKFEALSDRRA